MLTRPRFKPAFSVHPLPPRHVILIDERRSYFLEGRAYYHLAPLLTGEWPVEDLIARLEPHVAAHEVLFALQQLETRGYIAEPAEVHESSAAFWHQLGVDPPAAEEAVAHTRVRVVSVHAERAQSVLSDALCASRIRIDGTADLAVVVTDDYLRPELEAVNGQFRAQGVRWLLAKPVGSVLWLGPWFGDDEGPCWACMAQRIRGNRHTETYLSRASGGRRPPVAPAPAALPTTVASAAHLIALEVIKARTGARAALGATLRTINLTTLESRPHTVVRRPQCPVCGDPDHHRRLGQPLVLQSRPKTCADDGGVRSARPEETFARLAHHISPITGVVSSLEPLLGGPGELAWSYTAGHNFAMMTDSMFFLRQNLRGRSGGKGTSEIQAKVGGLCEAIERYSGVWRGEEGARRASYRELAGEALHPDSLMNYSATQYRARDAWNAAQPHTRFHVVPEPFDEDRRVDWTPVRSLTSARTAWAPSAYCYFGHPDLREGFYCVADANGSAAGNTLEEAILQGALELIERDAVAVWWYNRLSRPVVNLDSFGSSLFSALATYHERMHRELFVLDITSDLGVPTFVGVSRRVDRPVEDIIIGFGAHLDARVAIMRAIAEVNQFLPALVQTNADGSTRYWFDDTDAIEWWKTATLAREPYVAPDGASVPRVASDYPRLWTDDFRDDVDRLVRILSKAGIELFVNDQTRADVQFPVVKMIAPGLRHFWRRLGPGRLYDVPVAMGWRTASTREADLNPISIFF